MIDTMYEYSGVGLAAPQVHEGLRVFVAMLDADGRGEGDAVTFVNPEITVVGDQTVEGWEGCLSIPEMRGRVPRAQHIKVSALDRTRQALRAGAQGFSGAGRAARDRSSRRRPVPRSDEELRIAHLPRRVFPLSHRARETTTTTMSRTVVVTGGGRGIGRAIALAFAEPGAHIVITSRTESQLQQTAADIKAKGAEATTIMMDVSDEGSVAYGFGTLHGRVKDVNVLVNNAGVGGGEVVQGSDVARWKRPSTRTSLACTW